MSNIVSLSLATAETPRLDSRPRFVSEEDLSSLRSVSPWPAEGRFSQAFLQDMRHALGAQADRYWGYLNESSVNSLRERDGFIPLPLIRWSLRVIDAGSDANEADRGLTYEAACRRDMLLKTMNVFQRFRRFLLQANVQESNWDLGLYWATALWLVNKANATTPFGLKDFVDLAANNQGYSEQDFKKCEVNILRALKWQINPPVPSDMIVPVVHGMSMLLEAEKHSVCELTLQQLTAKTSLEDMAFHQCDPRELVVSAVLNSMEVLNKKTKDYFVLQKAYDGYKVSSPFLDHVKETLKRAISAIYE